MMNLQLFLKAKKTLDLGCTALVTCIYEKLNKCECGGTGRRTRLRI